MTTQYATVGFMVFFGGMIQTLAGLTEFVRNNMFAGTALSSYGAFWIGYALSTHDVLMPLHMCLCSEINIRPLAGLSMC